MRQIDSQFKKEVSSILNIHGIDNDCNTPDWILSEYLCMCLRNFGLAMEAIHDIKDAGIQADFTAAGEEVVI